MNKAEIIKDKLNLQDVMEHYGVRFNRGRAACPFHGDKHPSLTIKNGRYRCWSCGASGDCIDFVKDLFNIDYISAVNLLDADFNLGLATQRKTNTHQVSAAQRGRDYREERKRKIDKRISELNAYHRALLELEKITTDPELLRMARQSMDDTAAELDRLIERGGWQ